MSLVESIISFPIDVVEHYIYAVAFSLIIIGLLLGIFRATYVFGSIILILVAAKLMNIDLLYEAAVNSSVLTVMLLISFTGVLKKEMLIEHLFNRLKIGKNAFLLFLTSSAAMGSTVINNTPVVSLLTPVVRDYCLKNGWNPKQFLLPISFAAVAGGTVTLIGTSTNLVLNGMMEENNIAGFEFFEFCIPGIAVTLGVLILNYFLPSKLYKTTITIKPQTSRVRDYTTELRVIPQGTIDGLTVKQAKLRGLKNTFLVSLLRNGTEIAPVTPETVLIKNDSLFFTGSVNSVSNLLDLYPKGLTSIEERLEIEPSSNLIEAIIPNNSTLVGRKVKESDFRNKYDAVIIGIQRNGRPISDHLGEVILKAGDLLLLSVGMHFYSKNKNASSLMLVSNHKRIGTKRKAREPFFFPLLVGILLFAFILKWTVLFTVALMILCTVFCGITHFDNLKRDFNLQLYALLVLSVAFGSAIVNGHHADYFLNMVKLPDNSTTAILSVFGLTVVLTNFMTNVSAVTVVFPLGVAITNHYNINPHDVFLPIAFAASASFLTPSSYQTHLIVQGAGSYSNREFIKLGLPTLVIYCTIALLILL